MLRPVRIGSSARKRTARRRARPRPRAGERALRGRPERHGQGLGPRAGKGGSRGRTSPWDASRAAQGLRDPPAALRHGARLRADVRQQRRGVPPEEQRRGRGGRAQALRRRDVAVAMYDSASDGWEGNAYTISARSTACASPTARSSTSATARSACVPAWTRAAPWRRSLSLSAVAQVPRTAGGSYTLQTVGENYPDENSWRLGTLDAGTRGRCRRGGAGRRHDRRDR